MQPLRQKHQTDRKTRGFTLAELLVALAILGVIATFAIPKVLQAQQDRRKVAVFKETIATYNALIYQGISQNEIVPGPTNWNNWTYIQNHLNYTRYCNNGLAEGCWAAPDLGGGQSTQGAVVFPSGAVIGGLSNFASTQHYEAIILDWNGADGPNIEGEDRMILSVCYESNQYCSNGQRPMTVMPTLANPVSKTLYEAIFAQ